MNMKNNKEIEMNMFVCLLVNFLFFFFRSNFDLFYSFIYNNNVFCCFNEINTFSGKKSKHTRTKNKQT